MLFRKCLNKECSRLIEIASSKSKKVYCSDRCKTIVFQLLNPNKPYYTKEYHKNYKKLLKHNSTNSNGDGDV